jgi:hypothetical protein
MRVKLSIDRKLATCLTFNVWIEPVLRPFPDHDCKGDFDMEDHWPEMQYPGSSPDLKHHPIFFPVCLDLPS